MSVEENGAEGLTAIVTHAGGRVAAAAPKEGEGGQWLVLGSEKNLKKERAWAAKHLPKGTVVHSRSMLVDVILRQSLDGKMGIFTVN